MNHPNLGAKLLELDPSKGLGEKVSELVLGVDVAGFDAPLIQAAPDKVMLPSSKQLLIKWYLMQMCLLRSWKTGFFAMA